MKSVSTGIGLCVLGVCVLGAAALSSPQLGNTASAAGGRAAERLLPTEGGAALVPQTASQSLPAATTNLADCNARVEHWFSPVPHELRDVDCRPRFSSLSGSTLDLLGNGKPLCFGTQFDGFPFRSLFVTEFQQLPDGTTAQQNIAILSAADSQLIANLQALGVSNGDPDPQSGGGAADVDGDGDVDVILYGNNGRRYWLENIAGDAVRRSPYDLDHDGSVNTADVSLLLMEFTD
jgi:hypothetical protein